MKCSLFLYLYLALEVSVYVLHDDGTLVEESSKIGCIVIFWTRLTGTYDFTIKICNHCMQFNISLQIIERSKVIKSIIFSIY